MIAGSSGNLRLLLDEGMPLQAAELLTQRGLDAKHVLTLGLGGQDDERIIGEALRRGAVIGTMDSDFHRWLARHNASKPSVIRVRIEGLNGPPMASLLERVIGYTCNDLEAGAVVSVNARNIRSRRLPLKG